MMYIPIKQNKGSNTYLVLSIATDGFSEYVSYTMHCRKGINLETITDYRR